MKQFGECIIGTDVGEKILRGGHVNGKHRKLFDGAVSITAEQDTAETDRIVFTTVARNVTRTNYSTTSSVNMPMNSEFMWKGINERQKE